MQTRNLHSVVTSTIRRNEIKEDAVRWTCNAHLLDDKGMQSLVEITEEERLLGGFIHRQRSNIKINLKETEWDCELNSTRQTRTWQKAF